MSDKSKSRLLKIFILIGCVLIGVAILWGLLMYLLAGLSAFVKIFSEWLLPLFR